MGQRSFIQKIIIGNGKIDSSSEFKYAILRGQLGLLLVIVPLLYIFIDMFNGIYSIIPWYVVGICVGIFVIYQNRIKNYILSTSTFLITSNLLIYFITGSNSPDRGTYFYFITCAIMGLVLFYNIQKRMGWLFVLLSFGLAMMTYFIDWHVIEAQQTSDQLLKINFTVNLFVALVTTVFVVHFVISRYSESEKYLLDNQEELKNLTEELQKSKNRFYMATESSKTGIYEWDISKDQVYVSSRWKQLLGFENDANLNINLDFFLNLIHPEDVNRISDIIQGALESGSNYEYELRMRYKNGNYRWFIDSGLIDMKEGVSQIAIGSIMDIHERKIAETALLDKNKELQKANEELDRFVYSASHDMRAPLSTLLGLLDVARLNKNPEEYPEYFDMMVDRIHAMEGFIKEVTDYSRNSRIEVASNQVRLNGLVKKIIETFDILANKAGIIFNIDVDEDLRISTDAARLTVVLNNLISNAIKYHAPWKEERYVNILASSKNSSCFIKITDNGIGIAPEYHDKIFDMFFRASEKSDGSGLGLYIVKETLQKINGSITHRSNLEEGSSFEITIPVL